MAKGTGAQGLATHYALVAANPFVLTGANYNAFFGNGALERFDPAGGTVKITDEYLDDRINFLKRKLRFNTQDKNPYSPGAGETVPGRSIFENETRYFEDAVTGYKIQQGGLFANTPRYYFSDKEANNSVASAVTDYLFGGGGDDMLNGREGDDYLEGGTGTDTYTVNTGDGIDTIFGGWHRHDQIRHACCRRQKRCDRWQGLGQIREYLSGSEKRHQVGVRGSGRWHWIYCR